jgi:hypothetical protein
MNRRAKRPNHWLALVILLQVYSLIIVFGEILTGRTASLAPGIMLTISSGLSVIGYLVMEDRK